MKSVRKNTAFVTPKAAFSSKVAWYSLLAVVAALPVTLAIGQSPLGGSSAFTDDVYHIPKLLLLASMLSVATVAWVWDTLVDQRPLRLAPAFAFLGAFGVLAVVATATGIEPASSLFGVSGLSTGTTTWLACLWFSVLVSQYLTTTSGLEQLSWAAVATSTVAGVIAFSQAVGHDILGTPQSPSNAWMVSRGLATFGNPNYTGLYLIAPAIIAVGLALTVKHPRYRWLAAVCAAIISGALFITLTRAAWLGLALGLGLLVVLTPGKPGSGRRRALILGGSGVAVSLLGILAAGPQLVASRLSSISSGVDAFSSGRLTMWSDTLRAIANRPWFGTGPDRLALGAYEVQTEVVTEGVNRYVIQDPHSLLLLIAGSFGIPALVVFTVYAVMVMRRGVALARTNAAIPSKGILYAAWASACVGFSVASMFSVYTISAVFMLFLVLGVVVAPSLKKVDGRRWQPFVISLITLSLMAVALFGAIQGFRSARHVTLASLGDSQFHLEEAIRLAPWDTRTRLTYQWRKIGAYRDALQGSDIGLAEDTFATLDTEIRLQIQRAPKELLWYRMRIDLYQLAKGYPGYRADKVLEAIDGALAAFPDDPEFTEWRAAAVAGSL